MANELIRVRDFAKQCGCTPQNVYLHLKNYAKELDGHVITGPGRTGALLDDFAQDLIRSRMYPKELSDDAATKEINRLRAAVTAAAQERADLYKQISTIEHERDNALKLAGENQLLLDANTQELKEKEKLLAVSQKATDSLAQELGELREAYDQDKEDWERYRADLAAYNALNGLQRMFRKAPVPPTKRED